MISAMPSACLKMLPDNYPLLHQDADVVDFEFRLEDPVKMLPADELFSDGKLVPMQLSWNRNSVSLASRYSTIRSPGERKLRHISERSPSDPYLFSPKAPRCSSRWKELLGFTKLYQNRDSKQEDLKKPSASVKCFLHRSSKSSLNASVSHPLLKDSDNESSRFSLSSSSSGHEHDDLPGLSLDSDKAAAIAHNNNSANSPSRRPRLTATTRTRVGRSPIKRAPESRVQVRGVSVDSPRMNSSGKIVFHSLERSSSSPSCLNGGPKYKHPGMDRSYSGNIRVTPVLNVPVCSLRGSSKSGMFGIPLFSSPQKNSNRNRHTHSKSHIHGYK